MGLFSKKAKIYSAEEAWKYAHKNREKNYSFVEVPGGFKLISDSETKKIINDFQERREQFRNRITANGIQNKSQLLNRAQERIRNDGAKNTERYVTQNRQTEMER